MNIAKLNRVATLLVAFVLGGAPLLAGDVLDELKEYPPELLGAGRDQLATKMLEWQLARKEQTLMRLQRQLEQSKSKADELAHLRERIAWKEMGVYAHTSDEVRSQLIGKTLEQLLNVRLDIAASEALVKHLAKNMQRAESEFDNRALDAKEKALEAKAQLLMSERDRIEKLAALGASSRSEIARVQAKIAESQAEMAQLKIEAESVKAGRMESPLADARLQLLQLRARESSAETQLDVIVSAARNAAKIQRRQLELEQVQALVESSQRNIHRQSQELEELVNLRAALTARRAEREAIDQAKKAEAEAARATPEGE